MKIQTTTKNAIATNTKNINNIEMGNFIKYLKLPFFCAMIFLNVEVLWQSIGGKMTKMMKMILKI